MITALRIGYLYAISTVCFSSPHVHFGMHSHWYFFCKNKCLIRHRVYLGWISVSCHPILPGGSMFLSLLVLRFWHSQCGWLWSIVVLVCQSLSESMWLTKFTVKTSSHRDLLRLVKEAPITRSREGRRQNLSPQRRTVMLPAAGKK
jgi:hypothetical protein